MRTTGGSRRLHAINDLNLAHSETRAVLDRARPVNADWLLVAGDVAERLDDIELALSKLRDRFARVTRMPGNHEPWTTRQDWKLRGVARYDHPVQLFRELDVFAPEDPYPVWESAEAPVLIAPLPAVQFLFLTSGTPTTQESLQAAHDAGVV